jgi:hypothetical protein
MMNLAHQSNLSLTTMILNIQFTKDNIKQIRILNGFGNILHSNNARSTIKSTQLPVKNLIAWIYFIELQPTKPRW